MHSADQTTGGLRVWAAVPFKGPGGSKRRLAGLLDPDERARVSVAMLDGVLEALLGVAGIERVLLLTPGPRSAAIPSLRSELAPSLQRGQALAASFGAARMAALPEGRDERRLSLSRQRVDGLPLSRR